MAAYSNTTKINMTQFSLHSPVQFTLPGSVQMNTLSSLSFQGSDGSGLFVIDGAEFCIDHEINTWSTVTCDPASEVLYPSGSYITKSYELDLTEILKGVLKWDTLMSDSDFVDAVNYFWTCYMLHNRPEFEDKSFNKFPFKVSIPDLTSDVDNRITLIPAWTIQQNTSN